MPDTLISVVVPIYNARPYLEQCLDSLVSQTMQAIEFVCIDDGSTDDSLAILRSYAAKDARFRVITKENAGYGHTMNVGISAARGMYVGFLDPDDYVDGCAYGELFSMARDFDFPDIVKANHYNYTERAGNSFKENYPEEMCGEKLRAVDEAGTWVFHSVPAIWAAIYRVDFLNAHQLRLSEAPGVCYQDAAFVYKAWIAAESFVITHNAYHHYRMDNPNSSVKASGNVFRVCEEFDSIDAFLRSSPYADKLEPHVAARRLATYDWNSRRLVGEERAQFVAHASEELGTLRAGGVFQDSCMEKGQRELLDQIVDHPYEYYAYLTYGKSLSVATRRVKELEKRLREEDGCVKELEGKASALSAQLETSQAETAKLRERNTVLKKRSTEQKEQMRSLKELTARQKEQLRSQKERNAKQKEQIRTLEERAARYKKKVADIKQSKSYRIGRACTWLPRKLKCGLKRSGSMGKMKSKEPPSANGSVDE